MTSSQIKIYSEFPESFPMFFSFTITIIASSTFKSLAYFLYLCKICFTLLLLNSLFSWWMVFLTISMNLEMKRLWKAKQVVEYRNLFSSIWISLNTQDMFYFPCKKLAQFFTISQHSISIHNVPDVHTMTSRNSKMMGVE